MIKRAFIGLTAPRLEYDLVEPDPKKVPETIPIPPRLILLLNERLDSTKETLLKKGSMVKNGDRLFLYKDSTEYVLSPVNGTITSIGSYTGDLGIYSTYFIIEKDPLYDGKKGLTGFTSPVEIDPANRFLRALPGSPPFNVFMNPDKKIQTIIITGTDEDLLSDTHQYFLANHLDEIKQGIKILKQITGVDQIALTTPEKFKLPGEPEGLQIFKISSLYPGAIPGMIIKDHLNKVIPAGGKPEDLGICFISSEAVVSIARAYKGKKFIYDKLISVIDKDGTKTMVRATLGTPIHRIFKQLNITASEKDRIVIGGPMKGLASYTLYHPVLPDMDTIMIQDKKDISHVSDYPCINCGKCVKVCPAHIPVNLLVRFLEAGLYEESADSYDLESCIECGLCAYVCTAEIPILQFIRLGRHELLKLRSDRQDSGREEEEAANA